MIALHVQDHSLEARGKTCAAKGKVERLPCFLFPLQGPAGQTQMIPEMRVAGTFGQFLLEQMEIAFVFLPDYIGFQRISKMQDFKVGVASPCARFGQKSVHVLVHAT